MGGGGGGGGGGAKLVVKNKMTPRSGTSLQAVEPHPYTGAIKLKMTRRVQK